MPTVVSAPAIIEATGNRPTHIEEYIGRVNSHTDEVSIARMTSPSGWVSGAGARVRQIYRCAERHAQDGITGWYRRRAGPPSYDRIDG
jgi:hypothetical protein